MSSLQKFHRRTNGGAPATVGPFASVGDGNNTVGYWVGSYASNKLIVAPISTETLLPFSPSNARVTSNTTDGLTNTNTLYSLGSAAAPAAYYCKTLATGGYNTWYLPAAKELQSCMSNKSATPFATANMFGLLTSSNYWSSTEKLGGYAGPKGVSVTVLGGYGIGGGSGPYKSAALLVRAIRRATV